MAELEERLGLRLLSRTTRVVRVTDAGARFAADCRRILANLEEAETLATGTHAAPRGTLTLTAPVLFGQLYVTPILVRYLQQFPEVNAQCLFLDRVVKVVQFDPKTRCGPSRRAMALCAACSTYPPMPQSRYVQNAGSAFTRLNNAAGVKPVILRAWRIM